VVYATAAIYALLVIASIVVALLRWKNPGERYSELASRTESWWWMIGAFTVCVLLNQTVAVIFLAFISYLALKEYLSLIPTRRIDREVLLFAYLAIPIQYYRAAIRLVRHVHRVRAGVDISVPAATHGAARADRRLSARRRYPLLGLDDDGVHALPHGVAARVGRRREPVAGGVGLLFFLVVLTQFNDVAQYCWGKLLGRHKVTPHVSPKKTWEGLIGGISTTTLVAALAGPYSRRWICAGLRLLASSSESPASSATSPCRR
jgi:phosphatidate cytidylyltransferase